MSFPDGLFSGHGLIVKAVDEYLVTVYFIAALGKLGQICSLQIMDGGIQALALAQITVQILAFCIDHIKIPLRQKCDTVSNFFIIAWNDEESNTWKNIENLSQ